MKILNFEINNIFGGQSSFRHNAGKGQFLSSIGIDPEAQLNGKANGNIMPIGYTKFSSTAVSGAPMWMVADPYSQNFYSYNADGEFISYLLDLTSETVIGTPTGGKGDGLEILNKHVLLATPTDISTYGVLGGAPAITNTWWTVTAGLTALTNHASSMLTQYSVPYPQHAMHTHADGYSYVCDFKTNVGMIHRVGITAAGANDGSAYNVLDLPSGLVPYDIGSFGTDLAIVASPPNTSSMKNGKPFLFLWDCVSDSFYRQVELPCDNATAILNDGGSLIIFGGFQNGGCIVMRYSGGYEVVIVAQSSVGYPPFAGAISNDAGRVWFAGISNDITTIGSLYSLGYWDSRLGNDAINNACSVAITGTAPAMTAILTLDSSASGRYPIVGWQEGVSSKTYGISSQSASASKSCYFRSQSFVVGQKFKVRDIRIPLTDAVGSGFIVNPYIRYDNLSQTKTLNSITNSTQPSETVVRYNMLEIESSSTAGVIGNNDFCIDFEFVTHTVATGLALPIVIEVETLDD